MLCSAMLWEKYDTARTKGGLEWDVVEGHGRFGGCADCCAGRSLRIYLREVGTYWGIDLKRDGSKDAVT